MSTVGNANIDITADDSQARSTLTGFFGSLKNIGSRIAGVAGGIAVFKGISEGLKGAYQSTIGANASMEQYQNTLSVVMKSSEKAAQTLAWAQQFAAQTPFEIPGIVEATAKLESYGMDSRKVLGTVGDMAAVMGKPLMQAVEAVADAQTGELERLKEFGITKQMLIDQAAKMGKGEVVNAKGQITNMANFNDALFALMNDRFKGGMELQSKTWNGLISNAKDAMGTIFRTLSQPLFETLRNNLANIIPVISNFGAEFQKNFANGGIESVLANMLPQSWYIPLIDGLHLLQNAFAGLKQMVIDLQPSFTGLLSILGNLKPFAEIVGGALYGAFMGLTTVLPPVLNSIIGIVSAMTGWEGFAPLVTGLAIAFGAYKAVVLATELPVKLLALQTKLAAFWQTALNTAMALNPIGLVVAAILGLVAAFVIAYRNSETFRAIVDSLWSSLQNGFAATINWFAVTLPAWIASIGQWFTDMGSNISAAWSGIWSGVQNTLMGWIAAISAAAQSAWSNFTGMLAAIWSGIVNTAISIWSGLVSTITGIFASIWGFIGPVVTQLSDSIYAIFYGIVDTVTSIFSTGWNSLVLIVQTVFSIIQTVILAGWQNIKIVVAAALLILYDIFTGNWSAIGGVVRAAYDAIIANVQWAMSTIWAFIVAAFASLTASWWGALDYIKNIWIDTFSEIGANLSAAWAYIQGLWAAGVSAVISWAVNLWGSVQNAFWNGVNATTQAAANMWANIQNGFAAGVSAAIAWVQNLLANIVNAWNNIRSGAVNAAANMWDSVLSFFYNAPGRIAGAMSSIASTISNWFGNMRSDAVSMGQNIIQGLIDGIGNMEQWLHDKIEAVLNGAVTWAKHILGVKSPSTVFRGIGNDTGTGFGLGFMDRLRYVKDAAGNMAQSAVDAVSGLNIPMPNLATAGVPSFGSLGSMNFGNIAAGTSGPVEIVIHNITELDGREVGRGTYKHVTEFQQQEKASDKRFGGVR